MEREGDNSRSRNFRHGRSIMLNETINTLHHSRKRRLFGFHVEKVHVRSSPSPFGQATLTLTTCLGSSSWNTWKPTRSISTWRFCITAGWCWRSTTKRNSSGEWRLRTEVPVKWRSTVEDFWWWQVAKISLTCLGLKGWRVSEEKWFIQLRTETGRTTEMNMFWLLDLGILAWTLRLIWPILVLSLPSFVARTPVHRILDQWLNFFNFSFGFIIINNFFIQFYSLINTSLWIGT